MYRFGGTGAHGALGVEADTEWDFRRVAAVKDSVVGDEESLVGNVDSTVWQGTAAQNASLAVASEVGGAQEVLGRVPGLACA